jgi:hypothetical protein
VPAKCVIPKLGLRALLILVTLGLHVRT